MILKHKPYHFTWPWTQTHLDYPRFKKTFAPKTPSTVAASRRKPRAPGSRLKRTLWRIQPYRSPPIIMKNRNTNQQNNIVILSLFHNHPNKTAQLLHGTTAISRMPSCSKAIPALWVASTADAQPAKLAVKAPALSLAALSDVMDVSSLDILVSIVVKAQSSGASWCIASN